MIVYGGFHLKLKELFVSLSPHYRFINLQISMALPNDILINLREHDRVMRDCFCQVCRPLRVQQVTRLDLSRMQLHREFAVRIPHRRERTLQELFENTLDTIVYGKVFKETCLRDTGAVYFRSWAKHEEPFIHFKSKDFNNLCENVKECSWIFDNWETIVSNLTNEHFPEIDVRTLSIQQLYKAKSKTWCWKFNDALRRKKKKTNEPLYPEDKFNGIFQHIIASGILDDIEHSPSIASNLGGRLQSSMIDYCRQRYQPY